MTQSPGSCSCWVCRGFYQTHDPVQNNLLGEQGDPQDPLKGPLHFRMLIKCNHKSQSTSSHYQKWVVTVYYQHYELWGISAGSSVGLSAPPRECTPRVLSLKKFLQAQQQHHLGDHLIAFSVLYNERGTHYQAGRSKFHQFENHCLRERQDWTRRG